MRLVKAILGSVELGSNSNNPTTNQKHNIMKKCTIITTIIATTIGAICVQQANAWNIVCGAVCIGVTTDKAMDKAMATKWKSDSEALAGLGKFYLALSQLQAVEVGNITDESKKTEKTGEIDRIAQAKGLLTEASQHLATAISAAEELIPSIGAEDAAMSKLSVGRYKQLKELVDSFVKDIGARHLPDLAKLHEALDLAIKITSFGRDVSQSHVGVMGHTQGGPAVKW